MTLNTRLLVPEPAEGEAAEALIKEARQRSRRRRRRYALATALILTAAAVGGLALRHDGGADPPSGAQPPQLYAPGPIPAPPRNATRWTGADLGGGDGNAFDHIVVDPRDPGIQFAAAGSLGVFQSIDGGRSWRMLAFPRGGQGDGVGALAITARGPRVLYAGSSAGVFKSVDGGRTWQAANTGLVPLLAEKRQARANEGWIYRLLVHPRDPNLVYATSWLQTWRSSDGGDHWTTLPVRGLTIDPQDTQVLYASGHRMPLSVPLAETQDAVVKSTDGGRTWAPSGLPGLLLTGLEVNPGDPRVLFATTYHLSGQGPEVLYRSTDGGASWRPTSLENGNVGNVVLDPRDPDTVYAQIWPEEDDRYSRILKSTDGGNTWQLLFRPADMRAYEPHLLALDPTQPGTLYVGSDAGVLESTDAGATWRIISPGIPTPEVTSITVDPRNPGSAYAGLDHGGGVLKGAHGRWHPVNQGLTNTSVQDVAADPHHLGVLYAATDGGLFKTTNDGDGWQRVLRKGHGMMAVVVAPSAPATVYAVSSGGFFVGGAAGGNGLWKSPDRGAHWRLLGGVGGNLAVALSDPNTVYAYGADVHGARDTFVRAGTKIILLSTVDARTRITAVAVHPRLAGTVYAGTEAGLFRSTNAGQTWQRVGGVLAHAPVTAVATDPDQGGMLYAATENGILWSGNGGQTWHRFRTALPPRVFTNLAVTRTGMIYAGSSDGGGIVQLRTPMPAP